MTLETQRPSQLGPYRLLAEIGSGGMGVVYRGVHIETRAQVAIKTVRVPRPSLLATLRREIRALTRLRHPGIVRVIEESLGDAVPWYAMELLQGRTLAEFRDDSRVSASVGSDDATTSQPDVENLAARTAAAESGPASMPGLPLVRRPANPWLAEGLAIVRRLCPTLAYLHGSGIVHRDLKPGNILIRPDGTPVLTDFGLVAHAWDAGGRQMIDVDVTRQGTPAYMAPEQIQGQLGDARIDLYALGCILYELVAGQPPFVGRTIQEVLLQQMRTAARPVSDLMEDVPQGLEDLISGLLAKDPRERIGYADDVSAALGALGVPETPMPDELRPRAYLYRSHLVGRAAISDQIRERLAECSIDRRGRIILVGAESGAGKTALAGAIGRLADTLNMEVVMGACHPVGSDAETMSARRASPLHAFRPLLQTIADCCVSEGAATTELLLGPGGHMLGAYEPALNQVPRTVRPTPAAELPPDAARDRLLSTLGDVLDRFAARRPLLLVLDDLQWADELSMKFLQSLAADHPTGPGLVLLGTYRREEAGEELQRLVAHPGVESVPLPPLDDKAIDTFVGEMLALHNTPRSLTSFLARCSGGNPLFIGEYLRAAVDERLLYRESGSWRVVDAASGARGGVADYEWLPLPASLQALVSKRLASVGLAARGLLEAAAVIGKEFDLDLLLDVAGGSLAEGFDAANELIDRRLLEQTSDTRLAFVHDKIREIEYGRLDEPRRRELHRAAGTAIEKRWSGAAAFPLYFGELAHHWTTAGDPAKAIDYLEQAGGHALATSAYVDALGYLSKAIEMQAREHVPVNDARQARWHLQLGDAYRCVDDFGKSRAHLQKAVELHGWPVPAGRGAMTAGVLREIAVQVAHRWGFSRAKNAAASPGLHEATSAYISLLPVSRVSGDPMLPLYATLRAVNLADRTNAPSLRGIALGMMQVMLAAVGLRSMAARYDDDVVRTLAGIEDPASRAMTLLFISVYHLFAGRWRECREAGEQARTISAQIGLRRIWEEASTCVATTYLYRVEAERAMAAYQEISDSARRGADRVQAWSQEGIAVMAMRRGLLDQAEAAVERALRVSGEKLELVDGVLLNACAAIVHLNCGRPRQARTYADRATALIAQTPSFVTEHLGGLVWLMEVYVELWRQEAAAGDSTEAATLEAAARKTCQKALSMVRGMPFAESDGCYWLGECEWLSRQPAKARRQWERALARAEALDMPFQQARAHLALSRADIGSDAARRHRDLARQLFDGLGVRPPGEAVVSDPS